MSFLLEMLGLLVLWSNIVICQYVVEDRTLASVLTTSLKLSLDLNDSFPKGLGHVSCPLGSFISLLYLHLASQSTRPSVDSRFSLSKVALSVVLTPTTEIV